MYLIGVGLIILVQSISILGAVYMGYKMSQNDLSIKPDDIPDNFIEKLFGKKQEPEQEKEKYIDEDLDDKRKAHAFYD